MPLPALLLPILASALPAPASSSDIVVTGHAGPPFISPMGEPFRSRTGNGEGFIDWFRKADRNHDGVLGLDEMQADAERFFGRLDTNGDGQIEPDELVQYEWQLAPEIQVNSRLRRPRSASSAKAKPSADRPRRPRDETYDMDGLQGAARYALLNMPEPVAAADADFNRAVSLAEFRQAAMDRFQLLDTGHQGSLSFHALQAMLPKLAPPGTKRRKRADEVDTRVGTPLPPGP